MKQIGNLAVVCAGRPDVWMEAGGGVLEVHVRAEHETIDYVMDWDDDKKISEIVRELNFGRHARK